MVRRLVETGQAVARIVWLPESGSLSRIVVTFRCCRVELSRAKGGRVTDRDVRFDSD